MMQLDDIIFFVFGILCCIFLKWALGLSYVLRCRALELFSKRILDKISSFLEAYVDSLIDRENG